VPSGAWVSETKEFLRAFLKREFKSFCRGGMGRAKDAAADGNDEVAAALADGHTVIGISQSPARLLPRALTSAADLHIRISSPGGDVIRTAMRRCLHGRVPAVPDTAAAGLDFDDIVAALRQGSHPTEALARLLKAVRSRIDVGQTAKLPTLAQAAGDGEAREWAFALCREVAHARETGDFTAVPNGVLYGPPGTGKSLLIKVLAHECGLPLIATSVSDLFANSAGFLDSVIKAQRDVFARAALAAPSMLFLDEIDALPNRATLSPRGRDWWLPVIDDFLLLTDSVVSSSSKIILLGATNRIDDLDAALLRPGRFARKVHLGPPDATGLAGILRHHLGADLADVDLTPFARMGAGATGAEAAEWVMDARRRARGRPLTAEDLQHAIAPPETRNRNSLRRAATHEAGHAVVLVIQGAAGAGLEHVSIIPKGISGGHVRVNGMPDFLTAADIDDRVVALLAARAAETVLLGAPASGAQADLEVATRHIAARHLTLGLGRTLLYKADVKDVGHELRLNPRACQVVERDLRRCYRRAEGLVRRYRVAVEAVAAALMEKRILTRDEIVEIVRRNPPRHPRALKSTQRRAAS
jgi:SpoVK/Ycf46/Vps4 family AAA+-type ATPase